MIKILISGSMGSGRKELFESLFTPFLFSGRCVFARESIEAILDLTEFEPSVQVSMSINKFRAEFCIPNIDSTTNSSKFWHEVSFLRQVAGIIYVLDSRQIRIPINHSLISSDRTDLISLGRDPDLVPIMYYATKLDLEDSIGLDGIKREYAIGDDDLFTSSKPIVPTELIFELIRRTGCMSRRIA